MILRNKCEFKTFNSSSILHSNIHSIQLHIDNEYITFLKMLNFTFDIITISESKLKNQSIVDITPLVLPLLKREKVAQ